MVAAAGGDIWSGVCCVSFVVSLFRADRDAYPWRGIVRNTCLTTAFEIK